MNPAQLQQHGRLRRLRHHHLGTLLRTSSTPGRMAIRRDRGVPVKIGSGKFALVSATNAAGNKTRYAYDSAGYLTSFSGDGETHTYTYADTQQHRQAAYVHHGDGKRRRDAGQAGDLRIRGKHRDQRMKAVIVDLTPRHHRQRHLQHVVHATTRAGSSKRISQADGTRLTFAYDNGKIASGHRRAEPENQLLVRSTNQTTVTDALGKATVYEYDSAGQLKKSRRPRSIRCISSHQLFIQLAASRRPDPGRRPDGTRREHEVRRQGKHQIQQRDSAGNTSSGLTTRPQPGPDERLPRARPGRRGSCSPPRRW